VVLEFIEAASLQQFNRRFCAKERFPTHRGRLDGGRHRPHVKTGGGQGAGHFVDNAAAIGTQDRDAAHGSLELRGLTRRGQGGSNALLRKTGKGLAQGVAPCNGQLRLEYPGKLSAQARELGVQPVAAMLVDPSAQRFDDPGAVIAKKTDQNSGCHRGAPLCLGQRVY